MRILDIPESLPVDFAFLASRATNDNRETCGVLFGKEDPTDSNRIAVQFLFLPQQSGTSDACQAELGGDLEICRFAVQNNVMIVGWIHVSAMKYLV